MNCEQVNEKLLFFLDNELTEKEKQELELHLAACSACQEKLQDLEKTREFLRQGFHSLTRETASSWLWMDMEQQLAVPHRRLVRLSSMRSRLQAFIRRQPRWKMALEGILLIVLITGSLLLVPRLMGTSPEVLASDIALDTPEVRALAGGTPSVESIQVSDNTGYVLSQDATGGSNLACVNLPEYKVEKLYRLAIPPLTTEEETQSFNIATSDPQIKQILDSGGTISTSDMYPLSPRLRLEVINGKPVVWNEGTRVGVVLRLQKLTWIARVDLDEEKVVGLFMVVPSNPDQPVEPTPVTSTQEKVVNIAQSDARVSALIKQGAKVVHVALGQGRMEDRGAVILKLGEAIWSIRVDLGSRTVTGIDLVPQARSSQANIFNPE